MDDANWVSQKFDSWNMVVVLLIGAYFYYLLIGWKYSGFTVSADPTMILSYAEIVYIKLNRLYYKAFYHLEDV